MFPSKLLFLTACIPLRLALAYIAKTQPVNSLTLQAMGLGYLLVGIGMTAIYLFGLRPTGAEAGGPIWWNSVRPLHAVIYFLFSYLALTGSPNAWMALLGDVLLGLTVFAVHYIANVNFF
jgi:hypothetical protein